MNLIQPDRLAGCRCRSGHTVRESPGRPSRPAWNCPIGSRELGCLKRVLVDWPNYPTPSELLVTFRTPTLYANCSMLDIIYATDIFHGRQAAIEETCCPLKMVVRPLMRAFRLMIGEAVKVRAGP